MALSVSQLAAITHRLIIPKLVDNFYNSNPLFFRFKRKGIKYESGREIVQPIVFADLTTTTAYEGGEVLPTLFNDTLTAAVYQWRQYTTLYGVTGREEIINGGRMGVLNLLESKRRNAELSLSESLGTALQGANAGGKDLDGLGNFLSTSTTHGGIAPADFAQWVARVTALAVAGTLTKFEIQKSIGSATIGNDVPTVGVTRQTVYDKIWSLWEGQQRFTDDDMAKAGFGGISVNGIPVVVDSHVDGTDGGNQDNHLQFLNENYVGLTMHSGVNFKVVPIPMQKDQDVKMVRILWAGNMWASLRKTHVVIETIDPEL